jgi:hypothetical protein
LLPYGANIAIFRSSANFVPGKSLRPAADGLPDGRLERGVLKLSDFFANVLFFRNFVP